MKKKLFLIPSLIAAGFLPSKASALPGQGVSNPAKSTPLFERLRLRHIFTLAGHSSHSSHASHSSHTSHASSTTTTYVPPSTDDTTDSDVYRRPKTFYSAPSYDSTTDNNSVDDSSASRTSSDIPASSSGQIETNVTPNYDNSASVTSTPETTQDLLKTLPGNSGKFKRIVLQVQSALFLYGYYKGELTGMIDDPSRDALRRMQGDYKLAVTETVTPDVLTALGIEAR